MNYDNSDGIFKNGQALIISDGAILAKAIEEMVYKLMDKYNAEKNLEIKNDGWVEQHVAAEMLGVSIWTLARRCKSGQIERVPVELIHTRDVYYYMRDIEKEKAARDAKRALKKKEVNHE